MSSIKTNDFNNDYMNWTIIYDLSTSNEAAPVNVPEQSKFGIQKYSVGSSESH